MKFKINSDLNITELKREFRENKKLVIENFLTNESAEILYNFFAIEMEESWWQASFKDFTQTTDGYGDIKLLFRTAENQDEIYRNLKTSQSKFLDGEFSYFFDRTDETHYPSCNCVECEYRKFINEPDTISWFSNLIDFNLQGPGEFFASRFLENHFLSPHHDHEKGKIATVLGLSKNWKAEWGGCLHFMKDDYKTVTKLVQPSFNKLSLFDIPTANGVPHYVSHVTPGCKQGRISYTGWYY